MDKMQDRRVLISADAKTILDEYIRTQKEKNAGVPGYMSSRNAVVSDIITKFIAGTKGVEEQKPQEPKEQEPITLATHTN